MAEKEKRMEEIYRQYRNNIYHLCLLYLKDLQRAEDAMQETFFRAWKRFDTYRGDSGEKTWLSAIAANVCRDWLRTPWLRLEKKSVPWDEAILQAAETQKDMDAVRAVMSLSSMTQSDTWVGWKASQGSSAYCSMAKRARGRTLMP